MKDFLYLMILFYDSVNNGFNLGFINIFYLSAILSGVCTIVYKNPVVSVLFLIGLFTSVASILILIGFNYIGLSYILVYIGAVSILFLFILMLINIRISELLNETNNDISLAVLTVLLFYYIIVQVIPSNLINNTIVSKVFYLLSNYKYNELDIIFNEIPKQYKSINFPVQGDIINLKEEIAYASSKNWDNTLLDYTNISSIGNIMYTNYSIWLIIVSIVLLLAMIGAIVITVSQKK